MMATATAFNDVEISVRPDDDKKVKEPNEDPKESHDDDDDIFPPLEQSHMGSTQRDVTLALQLSFFALLFGVTGHAASRAMRLLYVMLSLMIYLPRVMPWCHQSSRDTIILVAMGGFLYWLVLTPSWLWHLLMVLGFVIIGLQCQSLWTATTATTAQSGVRKNHRTHSTHRPSRTILRTLHIMTSLLSILAMVICLLLWPHYLSFHCAMNAYILYAMAAVMQAKMDHVAICTITEDDPKPSNKDDDHHHPCTITTANCCTVLFSTNFSGVQRQTNKQQHFVLTLVMGALILPIPLSMLLLFSCVCLPDAPWLTSLMALVLYSTLWPMWLLTTDQPSEPPILPKSSSLTSTISTTTTIATQLAMIWTMPLRIHVRSNASIVIETLATTIIYDNVLGASYQYYAKREKDEEETALCNGIDNKKVEDGPPSPRHHRHRRCRPISRLRVVVLELEGQRFLRLSPEDADGLIQAIQAVTTAKAQLLWDQTNHEHHATSCVPLSDDSSTFVDIEKMISSR